MRVLDLFSGIGGFSLGLERAGMKTVAFCENNKFCRAVLAKHWPEVPCYDDVRKLPTGDLDAIDVVCGGFPCQPFSSASRGRRSGTEAEARSLLTQGECNLATCYLGTVAALREIAHGTSGLGAATDVATMQTIARSMALGEIQIEPAA